MDTTVEEYVLHEGTVKISGSTLPKHSGVRAYDLLNRGISPIEFICIGANANQQAMKGMSVFAYKVKQDNPNRLVSFIPLRFVTKTTDVHTGEVKVKDCAVWRTVVNRIV